MTKAAIRQLIADGIAAALEAQATTMANTNRNKLMEVFIGGLLGSIEGNGTASKPQTLEEAITITQRLMEQQNRRQETIRTYAATPTENKRSLHCQVSNLQQSGSSDQVIEQLKFVINLNQHVGIKSLLNAASITAAHIRVNAAQLFNVAEGVNAASEEVSTAELVKDMDQDSAHMVAASKVPMLKPGEFELWRMRIEQYIQMIDYALWEVIENGATLPKTAVVEGLVSQLEILDEKLSQEDVNQKLLRSLSPEWNTHVVVWTNKAELETMSLDDFYNNLKVYEPEFKEMSSSSSSTQNMVFVSSSNNNTSSSNEAINAAHGVTTASTQVNTA
ncbi:hypothetical protein Tco_0825563 [Tanacetum coccineum]